MLELLQCTAELVGTRCAFSATANAVKLANDIIDMLSAHQLAHTLEVAIATTQEKHLLDDVILVGRHVN